jgi:hypothetical protein
MNMMVRMKAVVPCSAEVRVKMFGSRRLLALVVLQKVGIFS